MDNPHWIKINGPEDLPEHVEGMEWCTVLPLKSGGHHIDWYQIRPETSDAAYWSEPYIPNPRPTIPTYKETEHE